MAFVVEIMELRGSVLIIVFEDTFCFVVFLELLIVGCVWFVLVASSLAVWASPRCIAQVRVCSIETLL